MRFVPHVIEYDEHRSAAYGGRQRFLRCVQVYTGFCTSTTVNRELTYEACRITGFLAYGEPHDSIRKSSLRDIITTETLREHGFSDSAHTAQRRESYVSRSTF